MKKFIGFFILSILLLTSCKTTSLSKDESFIQLKNQIDSANYIFRPKSVMPVGGSSINLSSTYSLKVTKDTIIADLPYFGRAYSASLGNSDVGIKFISTDFTYKSIFNNSKNKWNVKIITNDTKGRIELSLAINSSGYGTLSIYDPSRQVVIFYGIIN